MSLTRSACASAGGPSEITIIIRARSGGRRAAEGANRLTGGKLALGVESLDSLEKGAGRPGTELVQMIRRV